MKAELNERLTRVGPGTPGGLLQRRFWQPVALCEEFDPLLAPDMGSPEHPRLIKAVRALGQDFVLVKNHDGSWALMDRDCPHRGADLAYARYESVPPDFSRYESLPPDFSRDESLQPDNYKNNSKLINIYPGDSALLASKSATAIRCPFHGWAFQTSGSAPGQCIDTPAEPEGSTLCQHIQQRSYPVLEKAGVVWAWLGDDLPNNPPAPLPDLDCFAAPASHSFAFKGLWHANWLQCFEVGMDPAHPSFLHRFLQDESLQSTGSNAGGKQFRSASAGDVEGEKWPMSRVMRELHRPKLLAEPVHTATTQGIRITALRQLSEQLTHVRITQAIFPHIFVIPLSETMTITQWHLPVDDAHTYWFSVFTSFAGPIDPAAMRAQRLPYTELPHYTPTSGAHNRWGFNPQEQQTRTFLGMGEDDINVHDQWAVESMGRAGQMPQSAQMHNTQDRTREHLTTSDKVIVLYRRWLQRAIDAVQASKAPEPLPSQLQEGRPSTVDGFAPTQGWEDWARTSMQAKRQSAP
jgi:phthalate 4,5-dioxygenase